jgi:predicted SAM-dependent methyltransferase
MKLHLGCNKRELAGYVHVDISTYPHIDYVHDVKTLPMFEDASVELIYASHVLEYFDKFEVTDVLNEWWRVLKPNGILRLAVPDFRNLIRVYDTHADLNLITGPLYGRWETTTDVIYHKTVYDFTTLSALLTSVGFRNAKCWNWREVFVNELEGFDDYSKAFFPHGDFDNGIPISLNVECTK